MIVETCVCIIQYHYNVLLLIISNGLFIQYIFQSFDPNKKLYCTLHNCAIELKYIIMGMLFDSCRQERETWQLY